MAICWERAVPLAFHLCCFNFNAVLVVHVPFPFDVWGRMWNLIISVPDHCFFIYFARMQFTLYMCSDKLPPKEGKHAARRSVIAIKFSSLKGSPPCYMISFYHYFHSLTSCESN